LKGEDILIENVDFIGKERIVQSIMESESPEEGLEKFEAA